MNISVIIPAYKKTRMLLANLKQNLPYLGGCEVIVVNDDPQVSLQSTLSDIKGIHLIENKTNMGFGGAVSAGIKASHQPYIMLLNSDVTLKNSDYKKCLAQFRADKALFAVAFAQVTQNGREGKNILTWSQGSLMHSRASDLLSGITGWAEGGSCMIDKKKYDMLGGFKTIYAPFYWEDVDLSYRAWKSGYSVLFNPDIEVIHTHESTIGTLFERRDIKRIAYRNQLLCTWLNITDPLFRLQHLLFLMKKLSTSLVNDHLFLSAWMQALSCMIYTKDINIHQHALRSDREIIDQFHV